MALSQEEIEYHAERIADAHLEDAEYSIVYEDEELEELEATEEDWKAIHSHIQTELVTVSRRIYDEYVVRAMENEAAEEDEE